MWEGDKEKLMERKTQERQEETGRKVCGVVLTPHCSTQPVYFSTQEVSF